MRALPLLLALALLGAGCIGQDPKSDAATSESIDAASVDDLAGNLTSNATANASAAPVARMSIFAASGAMLFKSSFTAEDPAAIVFADEKTTLKAIASDSEALASGATLTGFAWTLNGKPLAGAARQADVEIGEAGLYVLGLTVTDSNGKSDAHTVKLAVAPQPYDVTLELTTGPIAGLQGEGTSETVTFTLAADETKGPSAVQKVVIVATPDLGLDAEIVVTGPDGELGSADSNGHDSLDQTETIELGALALADYGITVNPFAGADPDGVAITITVTYLPIIPGLEGDGHGHAH